MTKLLSNLWIGPALAWLAIFAFFVIVAGQNGFLTLGATAGWMNVSAELGIIAIPIALLLIAGEFDLSVGSMVGAASIITAVSVSHFQIAPGIAVLFALSLGVAVGLFNATLVERLRLPSFIVTLSANFLLIGTALGLSRLLAGTSTISMSTDGVFEALFAAEWNGFNVSILWWLGATLFALWIMRKTAFGNWVYAVGGNQEGARRAGVPVERVKQVLFIWTAVSAALVGVIGAFEFNQGNATSGQGFVFQAPIAAVIGGVLITGGFGSVLGVVFGTLIYGIVSLGLFYTGWSTDWLSTFIGALLIIAVVTNNAVRARITKRKAA